MILTAASLNPPEHRLVAKSPVQKRKRETKMSCRFSFAWIDIFPLIYRMVHTPEQTHNSHLLEMPLCTRSECLDDGLVDSCNDILWRIPCAKSALRERLSVRLVCSSADDVPIECVQNILRLSTVQYYTPLRFPWLAISCREYDAECCLHCLHFSHCFDEQPNSGCLICFRRASYYWIDVYFLKSKRRRKAYGQYETFELT